MITEQNDPVGFLQALAERLTTVLEEENRTLRTQDMEAFQRGQDGKQKLLKAYEETLRALQTAPAPLAELAEAPKKALKAALAHLQQRMEENRTALKAARDSRRYVLNALREAAMAHHEELSAYSGKGQSQHAVFRRTAAMTAAPVALNQQL